MVLITDKWFVKYIKSVKMTVKATIPIWIRKYEKVFKSKLPMTHFQA